MSTLYSRRSKIVFLFSVLLSFTYLSVLHAAESGGYVEYPVDLSSRGPLGYILVQFVNSEDSNDSNQVEAIGNWLKDVELPYVFKHTKVNQATIYKTTKYDAGPGREQPDYYVLYRFYAVDDYTQIRDEISGRLNKALKKAPNFLVNDKVLFYQEHNRIRRMAPRDTQSTQLTLPDGTVYPLVFGNYEGLFTSDQSQPKYADYGFSQASRDVGAVGDCDPLNPGPITPEEQWTYITWYQSVRQHDVVGKYGPYDSARMWLLVPGQNYPNYVLTMYEYSPAAGQFDNLRNVWGSYYGYINVKDSQLASMTPEVPGVEGFNYYCTGPRGNLTLISELFKDK